MSEMKVSEAIDRLKVGDTVWIKGKVLEKDTTEQPLYVDFGRVGSLWLYEEHEFSLTEPKNEKVEVRPIPNEDYVWVTCASLKNEFLVPVRFVEFIEEVAE